MGEGVRIDELKEREKKKKAEKEREREKYNKFTSCYSTILEVRWYCSGIVKKFTSSRLNAGLI